MELDADQRLDEVVDGFNIYGHPKVDPRVTRIGRFLRRYWIDEIPQLYNLCKGDIKLVGIRPSTEQEWQRYPKTIMERALHQKPGLMGVQYAHPNTGDFDQFLVNLEEYLDRYKSNPLETDRKYLSLIVWNILYQGVRST